jgi:hypothetical protein
MKADFAFGGVCLEIRGGVANRECHNNISSLNVKSAGCVAGPLPEYRR